MVTRPSPGYLIGSHKLHGQWFAYGWIPDAGNQTKRGPGPDKLVFVGEGTSKEEAEQLVQDEIDRILNHNQRGPT